MTRFHGVLRLSLLVVIACAGVARAADPVPVHPRLVIAAKEVLALRTRVQQEPWKTMMVQLDEEIKARATAATVGDRAEAAMLTAFKYLVTQDIEIARASKQYAQAVMSDPAWGNAATKGLTLYHIGSRLAFAYDWCYGSGPWDAEFSRKVNAALKRHADICFLRGGAEQNTNPASNWQGIRYSSSGLMFLACDAPNLDDSLLRCHEKVVKYLSENLCSDIQSKGWNAEGLGYTYYPMGSFVGPYGLAVVRAYPQRDLRREVPAIGWTYWTAYASTTPAMGGIHPDFGDDNPGAAGRGTYAQAFWYAPAVLQPGLLYHFNRLWGMQGSKSFDRGDGGIIWSLLLHPGKAAEVDPMYIGDWVSAFSDTAGNGMFTLRNRYRDADDTVVQMYLKLRGNRGHNGPDLLSFRMLGLGTAWAVGGGRYGTTVAGQDVFLSSMNTLYPGDPDKKLVISEEKGVVVGRPGIGGDGCGTVVGRAALSNLGVQEHVRRLGVDYRRDTGTDATVIISDTSSNGLYWQLCTLESNKVKPLADGFEIEGENGASLRGYILHAAGKPNLKVGQRLRGSKFGPYTKNGFVHFQSADGAFAVVLTLVQKGMNHPRVSVEAGSVWTGEVSAIVNVGAARFSVTDQGIRRAPLPVVRPSVAPPVQ